MNKRMNKEEGQTSRYAEQNKMNIKERDRHRRCWLIWKRTNEENTKLKKVQKKTDISYKNKNTQIKMRLYKNKENQILWERQKKL